MRSGLRRTDNVLTPHVDADSSYTHISVHSSLSVLGFEGFPYDYDRPQSEVEKPSFGVRPQGWLEPTMPRLESVPYSNLSLFLPKDLDC